MRPITYVEIAAVPTAAAAVVALWRARAHALSKRRARRAERDQRVAELRASLEKGAPKLPRA